MEGTIGQRFELFLKEKNISNGEAAEMFGISKQQISSWRTGKTNITTAFLPVLVSTFKDLNARWLLTGEGSMFETDSQVSKRQYNKKDTVNAHATHSRDLDAPVSNKEIEEIREEMAYMRTVLKEILVFYDSIKSEKSINGLREHEIVNKTA